MCTHCVCRRRSFLCCTIPDEPSASHRLLMKGCVNLWKIKIIKKYNPSEAELVLITPIFYARTHLNTFVRSALGSTDQNEIYTRKKGWRKSPCSQPSTFGIIWTNIMNGNHSLCPLTTTTRFFISILNFSWCRFFSRHAAQLMKGWFLI